MENPESSNTEQRVTCVDEEVAALSESSIHGWRSLEGEEVVCSGRAADRSRLRKLLPLRHEVEHESTVHAQHCVEVDGPELRKHKQSAADLEGEQEVHQDLGLSEQLEGPPIFAKQLRSDSAKILYRLKLKDIYIYRYNTSIRESFLRPGITGPMRIFVAMLLYWLKRKGVPLLSLSEVLVGILMLS